MRVELADMNSVSAVRLLQHETVGLSRDRVKELEKQQQIRAEYERILDAEWTNTEGGSGGLGFPLFGGRSSGAATSTR